SVRVDYYYGFSAEIGGGQYSRLLEEGQDVVIRVPDQFATIQAALNQAAAQLVDPKVNAVVEIQDNEYYLETPSLAIPAGKTIELRSRDGARPVLVLANDFIVTGGDESALQINGLLIGGGSILVPANDGAGNPNRLNRLQLTHCTLFPGHTPQIGSVAAQPAAPRLVLEATDLRLTIDRCIVSSIRIDDTCEASITNSIVDALSQT